MLVGEEGLPLFLLAIVADLGVDLFAKVRQASALALKNIIH